MDKSCKKLNVLNGSSDTTRDVLARIVNRVKKKEKKRWDKREYCNNDVRACTTVHTTGVFL